MFKKTIRYLLLFVILSCLLVSSASAASTTVYTDVPHRFCISYDANGGTGAPEYQLKFPGDELILSSEEPLRDSWRFLGWAEHKDAVIPDYEPGGKFTEDRDIILYAVWARNFLVGDANEDGKLDAEDYLTIMKYMAGIDVKINLKYADVNNDGVLSPSDYISLMQQLEKKS